MRITVVNFYGKGGMLYYAVEFARALAERAQVRLILPQKDEGYHLDLPSKVELVQVQVPEDFSRRHVMRLPLYALHIPNLVSQLRAGKPDIIHFTNENIWLTLLLPFLRDLSPVWTLHDPIPHLGDSLRKRLSTRILGHFCRLIFVHYEFNRKVAQEQGYKSDKLIVVPHGDYAFFEKYKDPTIVQKKMVLFWGRIRPYKGVEVLIRAAHWLPPDVQIIIAGDGAGEYAEQIGNDPRFLILDRYLSEDEIARLCQEAAVVVVPYLEATQSGIVPVAYAFSKPVVTTNVGALPDQVEDNVTGILVPPRDPKALAQGIFKILDNPQTARVMGEAGYAKSRSELSWRNVANISVSAYARILKNPQSEKI